METFLEVFAWCGRLMQAHGDAAANWVLIALIAFDVYIFVHCTVRTLLRPLLRRNMRIVVLHMRVLHPEELRSPPLQVVDEAQPLENTG